MKAFIIFIALIFFTANKANSYDLIKLKSGKIFRGVKIAENRDSLCLKEFNGDSTWLGQQDIDSKETVKIKIITSNKQKFMGRLVDLDTDQVQIFTRDNKTLTFPYDKIQRFDDSTLNRLLISKGHDSTLVLLDFYGNKANDEEPDFVKDSAYIVQHQKKSYFLGGLSFFAPDGINIVVGVTLKSFHARYSMGGIFNKHNFFTQGNLGVSFAKWEHGDQNFTVGIGSTNSIKSNERITSPYSSNYNQYSTISYYFLSYTINYYGIFVECGFGLGAQNSNLGIPILQLGYVYEFK